MNYLTSKSKGIKYLALRLATTISGNDNDVFTTLLFEANVLDKVHKLFKLGDTCKLYILQIIQNICVICPQGVRSVLKQKKLVSKLLIEFNSQVDKVSIETINVFKAIAENIKEERDFIWHLMGLKILERISDTLRERNNSNELIFSALDLLYTFLQADYHLELHKN